MSKSNNAASLEAETRGVFVRIHWSVVLAAQPDKRHKPAVSKRASARRSDSAGIVTRKLLRTIGLYRPACAMDIVGDEHDNRSLGIRFSPDGLGISIRRTRGHDAEYFESVCRCVRRRGQTRGFFERQQRAGSYGLFYQSVEWRIARFLDQLRRSRSLSWPVEGLTSERKS